MNSTEDFIENQGIDVFKKPNWKALYSLEKIDTPFFVLKFQILSVSPIPLPKWKDSADILNLSS